MKAKLKALLTLFIIAVLLATAYIIIPSRNTRQLLIAEESIGESIIVTNFAVSELLAIALTNEHGAFGILNNPEGITLVRGAEGNYSSAQMRAFVYLACNLKAASRLDIIPESNDIANALAFFSLILSEGREYGFVLLQQSLVTSDYLLFSYEHQAVFLISQQDAAWFLRSSNDFFE
jgi:hypothetical protein